MTCRASSSLTGAHPQCHVIPKLRQFVKFLAVLSVCLQWPYLHSTECRGRCLWSRAPAVLRGPTGQTRRGNRAKRCHVGGPISPCPRELATHCKARKQGQRRRRQRGSVRVCHVIKLLTLSVNLSLIWHSCKLKPEIQAPLPFFKKKNPALKKLVKGEMMNMHTTIQCKNKLSEKSSTLFWTPGE